MAVSSYFKGTTGADKPAIETMASVEAGNNGSSSPSITIPGYEKLVMKAGQVKQTVELFNPENNDCYMMIEILLPDGTSVYKTGMLEPGTIIKEIDISKKLQAGSYDGAIMRYSNFDLKNFQELNGAETIFNLEVEP